MKYFSVFLLLSFLLLSCSSDDKKTDSGIDISGSRIKPFSSCEEIEGIVSKVLYNNRVLNEDRASIDTERPSFRCEWEQERTYDPNEAFIRRATSVRTIYGFAHMTQEELIEREIARGVQQVADPRLNQSDYKNIVITKSFNELIRSNTYVAYVWEDDVRISRIVIDDINLDLQWSDNVPDLLDDVSVADIFIQMLVPL